MLVLSRKLGEQIVMPTLDLAVTVVAIEGNRVRLGISAPDESFPEGAPAGPPRVWIAEINSNAAKEALEAVSRDSRVSRTPIDRDVFRDTMDGLRQKADKRELEELKSQQGDDRLAEIHRRLSKQP